MIHWLAEKLGLSKCPGCHTLVDYAMDGLEGDQRGTVRKHLAGCPPCMEQVRDFLQVNEGLGLMAPETDCPEGFEQKVLQRLKQEELPVRLVRVQEALSAWAQFWLRLGPVFACLSVVMTLVALGALIHSSGSAAPSSELGQMTEALIKDPKSLHVSLVDAQGATPGGELVFCPGMKNIYLKALHLVACRKGSSYVLWIKPEGSAPAQRLAGLAMDAEGDQYQLLQLPQAVNAKGKVQFMLTQDAMDATVAQPGEARMTGSVSL